jgi:16S rRNA (uracil1498-N3)-methyltransferase
MRVNVAGLGERAAASAQVVVGDLDAPVLTDEDAHHLSRVLRLRANEAVVASDGHGNWRMCEWNNGTLETTSETRFEERLEPLITVGFALTKGDKPELVVQKLTEIGVDVMMPLVTEHTIVKWDAQKAAANVERFRRIAREAAMQSRRVWLPDVTEVMALSDLDLSQRVLADAQGETFAGSHECVLVGPEGGWSAAELAFAAESVNFGPNILRAETAALAVGMHLCGERWRKAFTPNP